MKVHTHTNTQNNRVKILSGVLQDVSMDKGLATKSSDPSSIPRGHTVNGKNRCCQVVPLTSICIFSLNKQIQKYQKLFKLRQRTTEENTNINLWLPHEHAHEHTQTCTYVSPPHSTTTHKSWVLRTCTQALMLELHVFYPPSFPKPLNNFYALLSALVRNAVCIGPLLTF